MDSKFKCVVTLKQVTPMIHFQYDDFGACLRASDVKPRLDKYIFNKEFILRNKFENKEDYDEKLKNFKAEHKGWFIKPDDEKVHALNYRMTISVGENPRVKISSYRKKGIKALIGTPEKPGKLNDNDKKKADKLVSEIESNINPNNTSKYVGTISNPKSYFGNMASGSGWDKCQNIMELFKEGILYESEITLTVFTMNTELLSNVKKHISNFFLINNFGTRSDKGLGSFYVVKVDGKKLEEPTPEEIANALGGTIYKIDRRYNAQSRECNPKQNIVEQQLNDIWLIYSLMKGGYNSKGDYFKGYIYRYFFSDGKYYSEDGGKKENGKVPRNDKAFMKRTFFKNSQDVNKESEDHVLNDERYDNDKYRYVRAFLGVPDTISFRKPFKKDDRQVYKEGNICIHADNEEIQRVPSPIVFKVLPNHIFILPGKVDDKLLGSVFTMEGKKIKDKGKDKGNVLEKTEKIKTPDSFEMEKFLDGFMKDFNDNDNPSENRDPIKKKFKTVKSSDFCRIKQKDYKIVRVEASNKEDKPT